MIKIVLHPKISDDLKLCRKKKWYPSLGKEILKIYRLLVQDKVLPGESPVNHIKTPELQNKIFHAGINLPKENTSKRRGARIIYIKSSDLFKIIYLGGHKDKRYDDSHKQIELIEERCKISTDDYLPYEEI